YAVGDLSRAFGLSQGSIGLILGAFGIGYLITTFFGGIWTDRYGAHKTLLIASLLWSIAIGATGLATGFAILFAARVLLGIAEGPNFPVMNRVVTDWLSPRERAMALSSALVAVPLALAIGAPIVTFLILHIGWRGMFLILAALSLLWVPIWWIWFRDFPEHSPHVNEAELSHIREGGEHHADDAEAIHERRRHLQGLWKFLFTNPTLLANNWAFFVFGYFLFFFMTWMPSYLSRTYGMDLTQVGLFSILPWLFAAILLLATGRLSDALLKRTGRLRIARSHPIWISQLLAALSIVPVVLAHSEVVALIFVSLAVGFGMASNSTFYAINADLAPARSGTALGVMDTFFAISGFAAPAITGWLVNATGNFNAAFWLMAALSISSVLVVLIFHRPDGARLSDEASE
ncbi:MAG: MFS transporter, partial [Gammaproteobacteria bacterium]